MVRLRLLIELYQSAIILNLFPRAGDGTRTHDLLLGKETFYQLNYTRIVGLTVRPRGAESQNRTGDTLIFSQVLYQLSYLGSLRWIVLVALDGVKKEGVGVVMSSCPTPLCIEMIFIQLEI